MGLGARLLALLLPALLAGTLLAAPSTAVRAGDDEKPPLTMLREPHVKGVPRYGRTLEAVRGRWRPGPTRADYEWLRDGRTIRGETGFRYEIRPRDVGHRLAVRVTVYAPEHRPTTVRVGVGRALHRVPVRRTVNYSVRVKGDFSAGVQQFKRLAQETYDDPRGWRGRGVDFHRVAHGGAFTLWISAAHLVPSFSSGCSAYWSCRVGRNVIINRDRWRWASPAWNNGPLGRRAYRHMVVNHETGHWLGFGHASCPAPGAPAPVMMQQSKGTDGCRFNPWPTLGELRAGRVAQRQRIVDVE